MTELPDDIEQLKAILLKLQEENQCKDEAIATLEKTIQTQAEECKDQMSFFTYLNSYLFG
ncbi:hypothetical protein [Photobacterium leiognathi]|uniref:hypothetical protein n=1 Tax=Photobacterium leiognathi TaxID=553611 RepID=UPI00273A2679|nr:hypothetical protein [Photobacterium leiognathi]